MSELASTFLFWDSRQITGQALSVALPRSYFTTILKQMRRQATVKNAAYTEISRS